MLTFYSQNVWNVNPTEVRNNLIRSLISEYDADVCAFQECGPLSIRRGEAPLPSLMSDVYTEVCPDISHKNFTPVFYKTNKFNLVDSGYMLYDGLNDAESKSITWAVLEEKTSLYRFAVMSTHFWWMADSEKDNLQRLENVRQLKELCDSVIAKYNVPVIIGGDFNNGINAEQGDMPYRTMLKKGFSDIRLTASKTTEVYTHRDLAIGAADGESGKYFMTSRNLDYIFTYGDAPIKAVSFAVDTSEKALCTSDHCPLIGQFE